VPVPTELSSVLTSHPSPPPSSLLLAPHVTRQRVATSQFNRSPSRQGGYHRNSNGDPEAFVCWPLQRRASGRRAQRNSCSGPSKFKCRGTRRSSLCMTEVEKNALGDALKRRANRLCMPLYVENHIQRQMMRAGTDATAGVGQQGVRVARRGQVKVVANRFDEVYAKVGNAMEKTLSFRQPERCHSVDLGQLQLFTGSQCKGN
jgi:hypothetical protein